MKTDELAKLLAKDLSKQGILYYLAAEEKTLENCKKYGRSSRTAEKRVKAAKIALTLKEA